MINKKTIIIFVVVVLFVVGAGAYLVYDYNQQNKYNVESFTLGSGHGEYKTITYEGQKYNYNPRMDTFLYIGVDETDGIDNTVVTGRADTIMLFAINKDTGKVTVINLSRDTMTEMRTYTAKGDYLGQVESEHLLYAYSFAGGGKAGCINVAWSVSKLLNGIPIEEYVATDISTIENINDIVGGVTVTVPNDDLKDKYPEMVAGAQVDITKNNVQSFVRYRDTSIDFSNNGRRERQKAYLGAFMPKFAELLNSDLEGTWTKIDALSRDTVTSITKNKYLNIANTYLKSNYSDIEYYTVEGENRVGTNVDEFYVDEDALLKKVLEIFYNPS